MTQEDESVVAQRASTAPPSRKLCEVHGLWYEPRIASGCVVCRRPSVPAAPPDEPRALPWQALAAMAFSALLLGFVLGGGSVLGMFGAQAPQQAVAPREVVKPSAPSNAPESTATQPNELSAAVAAEPAAPDPCTRMARGREALVGRDRLPRAGLHFAAGSGDLARVQEEIRLGTPLEVQDDAGRTPLAWALLRAQQQVALALIEARVNPNTATRSGDTPLMLAAASGDRVTVDALLAAGARQAEVNHEQKTALMLAAREGRVEALPPLASNAMTREMTCERGMTALHYAAVSGDCSGAAAVLLDHGALVDARDREGATPLLHAIEHGHEAVARLLLLRGAELNARDYKDRGAFDYVVRPPRNEAELPKLRDVLRLLIDQRADRRLGLDPRTNQILFRSELNDLATREGRPVLPAYEGARPQQASAGRSSSARPKLGSLLVFPRWELRPGRTQLPAFAQGLITNNGWRMVPELVASVLVRDIALKPGQRVTISGRGDDPAGFTVRGGLLIEMAGGFDAIIVGRGEELKIHSRTINRGSRPATYFSAREIDLTWLFTRTTGVVFTALADNWGFSMSDIHLIVEGPDAEATAARMKVQTSVPLPR